MSRTRQNHRVSQATYCVFAVAQRRGKRSEAATARRRHWLDVIAISLRQLGGRTLRALNQPAWVALSRNRSLLIVALLLTSAALLTIAVNEHRSAVVAMNVLLGVASMFEVRAYLRTLNGLLTRTRTRNQRCEQSETPPER
ncbi:MAG: hypothetical protein RL701_1828 [Pseudomonadota bacterium]|jgi:hypothetical protein